MPLVFFTLLVSMLWVRNCKGFLFGGLFGSGWSSPLPSIQAYLFSCKHLFIYYYYYHYYHLDIPWKFFTPALVWVSASLLRSPRFFKVFWPILTMSGWFWFFWFPILLVSFPYIRRPFQVHQLQLVSPSPSCFTAFLVRWQHPSSLDSKLSVVFFIST